MLFSKKTIIHKNVLGVLLVNGTDNYRELYNLPENCSEGVIIKNILDKSPIKKFVEPGDLICSFHDGEKDYKIDNYGETNVEWETGMVSLDQLVKRCIPKEKVKIKIFSVKSNTVNEHIFNLKTFDEVYPIKKNFSYIDQMQYEVIGGMIFMDLSINHLMIPQFQNLTLLIRNGGIFKPQLLITHIFPNSEIAKTSSIYSGTLVKSVNNVTVNSLTTLRKALKKPIIKNGHQFIIIENQFDDKVILNIKDMLDEENKLTDNYKYNSSSIIDYFINLF